VVGYQCNPDSEQWNSNGQNLTASSTCTDPLGVLPDVQDSFGPFDYDGSAPDISGSRSPSTAWTNQNVAVNFTCSDNGPSGIASCTGDTTVTTEGANQSRSGTATDNAGNTASATVSGISIDRSAPAINASRPAANAQGWYNGAVTVTFSCSDGLSGVASCGPNATLSTQGAGQAVTGNATDNAGNGPVGASSTGINIDTTAPVLTIPTVAPIEATGPTGAVAHITAPSATDNLATGGTAPGPVPVMCNRSLTTAFPLGTTAVSCTAADGHGLSTARSFNVLVRDTTPPKLPDNLPTRLEIYENTDGGASRSHQTIADLLAVKATDIVDTDVTMTNNAPAVFPREQSTNLTITGTDNFGNAVSATVAIFVRRIPAGANPNSPAFRPPSLDLAAPRNPTLVKVRSGDHKVTLTWQRSTSADLKQYVVTREIAPMTATRAPQTGAAVPIVVYRGTNTTFTDRKLKNGIQYRYVIASEDSAGNRSAGVAVIALPKPALLVAPKDGAQLKSPIRFRWAPVPKAAYYNLQLYRITGKKEVKILSTWPAKAKFTLGKKWVYNKRTQTLFADNYRWYIFPGFGKRSEVRYGAALGSSTFTIPKTKAAAGTSATKARAIASRRKP
jgi:hypothetical protein